MGRGFRSLTKWRDSSGAVKILWRRQLVGMYSAEAGLTAAGFNGINCQECTTLMQTAGASNWDTTGRSAMRMRIKLYLTGYIGPQMWSASQNSGTTDGQTGDGKFPAIAMAQKLSVNAPRFMQVLLVATKGKKLSGGAPVDWTGTEIVQWYIAHRQATLRKGSSALPSTALDKTSIWAPEQKGLQDIAYVLAKKFIKIRIGPLHCQPHTTGTSVDGDGSIGTTHFWWREAYGRKIKWKIPAFTVQYDTGGDSTGTQRPGQLFFMVVPNQAYDEANLLDSCAVFKNVGAGGDYGSYQVTFGGVRYYGSTGGI